MRGKIFAVCSIFVAIIIMIGCAPSTRTLQIKTSRLTGCPPDTIKISNVKVDFKTGSYTAECGDKTYDCDGDDYFRNVTCAERGGKPEPQSTATKVVLPEPQEQQPQLPAPLVVVAQKAPTDPENTLSRGLETLSQQLAGSLPEDKKLTVAVLDFNDLAGNVSALGRLVNEELVTKLFQTRRVKVIERGLLEKAINELKFTLSGLVDPNRAKQLGKQVGADAIVTGTIADLGSIVKINARMIEVEKGDVLAAAGVEVIKDRVISELMRQLLSGTPEGLAPGKAAAQEAVLESQPTATKSTAFWESPKVRVEAEGLQIGSNQIKLSLSYFNKTGEDLTIALDTRHHPYLLDSDGNRYDFKWASGLAGGYDSAYSSFSSDKVFVTLPPKERLQIVMGFEVGDQRPSKDLTFNFVSKQVLVVKDEKDRPRPAGDFTISIRNIVPR